MVIDLNFTDVVPDKCSSPRDYFQWIPTDEVTNTISAVLENGHENGRLFPLSSFLNLLFPFCSSSQRPGSRCLLGEMITYERRQSDACCYVDPEYDKPTNRTPCMCAIEDFEW